VAWSEKLKPLMGDLWTTFSLVIPAFSTTFASVERMLGYLPSESFGWLLLDEAGQATPQAAVGALMRSKRAVVVGDPMQLPPVTSLPSDLAVSIAREFRVDAKRSIAPDASVQTFADASSAYGTSITQEDRQLRIGVPLLVHRRCTEPMFSVSNKAAYNGLMVQGRGTRKSAVRDILGPSQWFDVKPNRCNDKWSEEEGKLVLNLLRRLENANLVQLDLYLVSPFRIVAQSLRQLLVSSGVLAKWTDDPEGWVKERVGTVYTVQGREAETVMLVLGAAQPERRNARVWAGSSPNQLNVAVTRAKENLYVIGNRFEWASAGSFEHLERALPLS
jgi:superfamily I DNA and/or RNA helicase